MKHWKELAIILPVLLLGILLLFRKTKETPPAPNKETPVQITLADLGSIPDWQELERYQHTITRATFQQRLETIYTKHDSWKKWITLQPDHALILTHGDPFRLNFANHDTPIRHTKKLSQFHIALDAGHIGGDFALMEERHLVYGEHPPIREGAMTLATAKILQKQLQELGAQVSLVRKTEAPVSKSSPTEFKNARLFYRTAEIRARANLVNETLKPDLVICLHFNASGSPIPIPGQHYHALINGAYHENELAHEDERFQMLHRLLARYSETEIPLAAAVSKHFLEDLNFPAYQYRPDHPYSVNIGENKSLWARNLLANRLYQCPVIYLEPYVMNSTEFIARFKKDPEAIYREYAQTVLTGLLEFIPQ